MARVDKLARWIAAGLLREQGVTRTPDTMAGVMPVSYRLADAAVEAISEIVAELAAELAGKPRADAGDQLAWLVAAMDLRQWESQFAASGPPENDGGM